MKTGKKVLVYNLAQILMFFLAFAIFTLSIYLIILFKNIESKSAALLTCYYGLNNTRTEVFLHNEPLDITVATLKKSIKDFDDKIRAFNNLEGKNLLGPIIQKDINALFKMWQVVKKDLDMALVYLSELRDIPESMMINDKGVLYSYHVVKDRINDNQQEREQFSQVYFYLDRLQNYMNMMDLSIKNFRESIVQLSSNVQTSVRIYTRMVFIFTIVFSAISLGTGYFFIRLVYNVMQSKTDQLEENQQKLKKAESYLNNIINSMPSALISIDQESRILHWNSETEKISGVGSQNAVGQTLESVFPQLKLEPEIIQNLGQTSPLQTEKLKILDNKYNERIYNLTYYPLVFGSIKDIVIRLDDITEIEAQEEHLRKSQKMEIMGTLAGGIAHDFNNILSGIFGFTEIAMGRIAEDSPARQSLQKVMNAGFRASDLVRQILTFCRQDVQELRPMHIAPVFKEVVKFMRASLPTTIELRDTIIGQEHKCLGDPTQIYQVLMNLTTNAAQAIGDKPGLLEVALSRLEYNTSVAQELQLDLKAGRYVKLSVKDNGEGMTPEVKERVFEAFFTTKEPGEGTGMGLSVTHGIVKKHDGIITVESEPGEGSLFEVYLPFHEKQINPVIERAESPVPTGDERLLVVDDEEVLTVMMKELFSSLGYRVTARSNSLQALEIFKDESSEFDLVVTDCTMPGLTGIELATELKKIREDIPIILVSGSPKEYENIDIKNSCFQACLPKPWNKREMAELIRNLLDQEVEGNAQAAMHLS